MTLVSLTMCQEAQQQQQQQQQQQLCSDSEHLSREGYLFLEFASSAILMPVAHTLGACSLWICSLETVTNCFV